MSLSDGLPPFLSVLICLPLWQVDGGGENTAKTALAICELLVARRLTRRVVLTRLMVGHTHEDIDAIFALIWQYMKNKKALTPQIYASMVAMACKNKATKVDVVDLWAVPDYSKYFKGVIHPDIGRYAKGRHLIQSFSAYLSATTCLPAGKWSQLQIIFEAVDHGDDVAMREKYPLGVKVSHRAYSRDEVKLLKRCVTLCVALF